MKKKKVIKAAILIVFVACIAYLYKPVLIAMKLDKAVEMAKLEDWYLIHAYAEKTGSFSQHYTLEGEEKIPLVLSGNFPQYHFQDTFYEIDEPANIFLVHGKRVPEKEGKYGEVYYYIDIDQLYIVAPIYRDYEREKFLNRILPRTYICELDVILGNYTKMNSYP